MKRIACIVLSAVLLCGMFVGIKKALIPELMSEANYGVGRLKNLEEMDTVFIGSSMFRQAIDISQLDEKSTYLLAYNGHQPFTEYLQMKELIDSGVKVDTFVVDMYAYTLTAAPKLSDVRMLQDSSLSFCLSLYEVMNEQGEADVGDLYEMLVTSNNEMFITWPVSFKVVNARYQNGGSSEGLAGSTPQKLAQLDNNLSNANEIKTVQTDYVKKMIALCEENDIDIVFVETPKYSYLYENSGYISIMNAYMDMLMPYDCKIIMSDETASQLKDEHQSNCQVYGFDITNAEYFSDLIHLSAKGKRVFTKELAACFQ